VEGVDCDLIKSNADDVFVGNDVEAAGMRGGSCVGVLDGPEVEVEDDEEAWVVSIGGKDVAGGTKGWVVCNALDTGRVKTVC
jgi:hypothetical protein